MLGVIFPQQILTNELLLMALDISTMQVAELESYYNRNLVIIPELRLILTTLDSNPLHRGI